MAKRKEAKPSSLAEWLESNSKTQEWLADRLGISAPFLSQIISGQRKPSIDLALSIETITGITPRQLLAVAS